MIRKRQMMRLTFSFQFSSPEREAHSRLTDTVARYGQGGAALHLSTNNRRSSLTLISQNKRRGLDGPLARGKARETTAISFCGASGRSICLTGRASERLGFSSDYQSISFHKRLMINSFVSSASRLFRLRISS